MIITPEVDMRNYRKIALSGIHGCGKTVLAKKISCLTNVKYVPEVARDLLTLTNVNGAGVQDVDKYVFYSFEKSIFYSYVYYISSLPMFVADRTLIDVIVYCMLRKDTYDLIKEFEQFLLSMLHTYYVEIKPYDIILFFDFDHSYSKELNNSSLYTKRTRDAFDFFLDKDKVIMCKKYDSLKDNLLLTSSVSYSSLTNNLVVIGKGTRLIFNEGEIIV